MGLIGVFNRNPQFAEAAALLLASIAYGPCFAAVQMIACQPLKSRPWIWPVANGIAFPGALLIVREIELVDSQFRNYLLAVLAGAIYGCISATVLVIARREAQQTPGHSELPH